MAEVVKKAAYKQKAASIFDKYEKTTGSLNREQAALLLEEFVSEFSLLMPADQQSEFLARQFQASDVNADGQISRSEFDSFLEALSEAASAIGSAVSNEGTRPSEFRPSDASDCRVSEVSAKDPTRGSLLSETGRARSELFREFDFNNDHQLNVDEALALLAHVFEGTGVGCGWITAGWLRAQFKAVSGNEDVLSQDKFQKFAEAVMDWQVHLGLACSPPDVAQDENKNAEPAARDPAGEAQQDQDDEAAPQSADDANTEAETATSKADEKQSASCSIL